MKQIYEQIKEQIDNHDQFIILAHKSIDLDAFGSALGMYEILKSYGKSAVIVMENHPKNRSIQKSMQLLREKQINIEYTTKDKLIFPKEKALVIILDTNKKELLEVPNILEQYSDCILLDHHIESENTLNNIILKYIDNNASSTSEMITRYLKTLKIEVPSEVATILLTGIVVDTNNFNIKTTSKTYEAAAYLMTLGASNIEKQTLLKENREDYFTRQDFVKKSTMVNKHMALCVMDHNHYQNHQLALIAEDLLQFDAVEASFTIGFVGKKLVGISARSVGEIDVEKYMRAMGGGGHKTDAACVIHTSNIQKVKRKLLKLIQE